jgi:transcriptional regulator with XRE-family HTH domain
MISIELKSGIKTKILIAKTDKSLREFSKKIGISHPYLSQVLSGKRNPSATVAHKISKGLGLEIEDIFLIPNVAKDNPRKEFVKTFE